MISELRSERLIPLSFSAEGFPRIRRFESSPGVLERTEVDFNGDGKIDFIQNHDPSGQWVEKESADINGDGSMDVVYTYKRNLAQPSPELVLAEYDAKFEGRPTLWKHYKGGKLARREVDRRGLGRPDYWEFYEDERLVRIEKDEDADGRPDSQPAFRAIVRPKGPEPGKKAVPPALTR
jgi:hypothetical protein